MRRWVEAGLQRGMCYAPWACKSSCFLSSCRSPFACVLEKGVYQACLLLAVPMQKIENGCPCRQLWAFAQQFSACESPDVLEQMYNKAKDSRARPTAKLMLKLKREAVGGDARAGDTGQRGRDTSNDRDEEREKEHARGRDAEREKEAGRDRDRERDRDLGRRDTERERELDRHRSHGHDRDRDGDRRRYIYTCFRITVSSRVGIYCLCSALYEGAFCLWFFSSSVSLRFLEVAFVQQSCLRQRQRASKPKQEPEQEPRPAG